MLQRAASNAYSWWWASHVRTKQSKWLEQSLQDMGDKVDNVLKLITQPGDSFAKRAEMYYKHRPELINFVEESFRAYQSLAERYDHISKELQNANSQLAAAFPDQFQYEIDDDDDDPPPQRMPRKFPAEKPPNPNIPKAPAKFPTKNIKAIIALANSTKNTSKDVPPPKSRSHANKGPKSGLTNSAAVSEIDKLQKQILTFQTEKEFAKSSYESGYAKYWSIEQEITGMQERISKLQDEFGISQAIDDEEARTLMAQAAIKSCQDTLAQLQEKQESGATEAKAERQKIKEARNKLRSLNGESANEALTEASETVDNEPETVGEAKDLEVIRDKIKEHFDVGATNLLTVTDMAEKIDELVSKVIGLETSVSSQTALIHTLRSETDELQSHINKLEEDKANLIEGKNDLTDKVSEMENKLKGLHELEHSELQSHINKLEEDKANLIKGKNDLTDKVSEMENKLKVLHELEHTLQQQNTSLETHLNEALSNLDTISTKLPHVKPDDESAKSSQSEENRNIIAVEEANRKHMNPSIATQSKDGEGSAHLELKFDSSVPSREMNDSKAQTQPSLEVEPQRTQQQAGTMPTNEPGSLEGIVRRESVSLPNDEPNVSTSAHRQEQTRKDNEPDWQQLFKKGEEKEKVILAEYTSTLQNYKEAKKRLGELEKKNQLDVSGFEEQLNELKNYNAKKDEEIHSLRQKLNALQKRLEEYKNARDERDKRPARNDESQPPPEDEDDIGILIIQEQEISPVEQKLRTSIDEILEENLDFWMRFSASFGQIQKFQNVVQDLFSELPKPEEKDKKEGSAHGSNHGSSHGSNHGSVQAPQKSDIRPIYKHLREIETELTVWLEQTEQLKEELQRRFSQLCNIQEEIKHAVNAGAADDDMKFTSYNAAKFQGEVANMQQENNKVADELQAGMDHITNLQVEVERTMNKLSDELGLSGTKSHNDNQTRDGSKGGKVPLSSFIFGVKPQKKKQSIFSCMHPAMMHRKYQNLKADKEA